MAGSVHQFSPVWLSRPGHEQFTRPSQPNQRRYEALRAYFVEGVSAVEVGARLGYARSTVEALVRDYRKARLGELFTAPRPGPKSQPKKDAARERALQLRVSGTGSRRSCRCSAGTARRCRAPRC